MNKLGDCLGAFNSCSTGHFYQKQHLAVAWPQRFSAGERRFLPCEECISNKLVAHARNSCRKQVTRRAFSDATLQWNQWLARPGSKVFRPPKSTNLTARFEAVRALAARPKHPRTPAWRRLAELARAPRSPTHQADAHQDDLENAQTKRDGPHHGYETIIAIATHCLENAPHVSHQRDRSRAERRIWGDFYDGI